ncbi:hypothetical protein P9222_12910 [Paenibacillus amylolyticus]|nr:hypothetical protein [Paenibacillus amylolyticus]WFR64866.1 hypothetical protein P9222_12910 [Paenibacillus amylolyticus]
MYPPQGQGTGGKKGGREDANLSQAAIEEVESGSEAKSKQAGNKAASAKRRTSKAPLKNKSKVSVSGKTSREGVATPNQRKTNKKRRNPWIQN